MKKIFFNDRFKLTEAVLSGRKTQTRRIINLTLEKLNSDEKYMPKKIFYQDDVWKFDLDGLFYLLPKENLPKYKVGEVVAVAQSYKDMGYSSDALNREPKNIDHIRGALGESAGWNNKMFVRADACKNQIRITNVRVDRLNNIKDADCLAEGVLHSDKYAMPYGVSDAKAPNGVEFYYSTPREAYAALIDKISGKGTWKSNPWVFVYDFELVK